VNSGAVVDAGTQQSGVSVDSAVPLAHVTDGAVCRAFLTLIVAQTTALQLHSPHAQSFTSTYCVAALGGHFGIAQSVRQSVPWRSSLGYRHAGCLQLSHRRLIEMCRLRTRQRTDVDPPRCLIGGEMICHRRTAIRSIGSPFLCALKVHLLTLLT